MRDAGCFHHADEQSQIDQIEAHQPALLAAFGSSEARQRHFQIVTRSPADQLGSMLDLHAKIVPVVLTFVLAGTVKGVTGLGLPTVSMALFGWLMAPSEAAALLIIPSLVTNVWQFAAGPNRGPLLRRTWPMLIAICITTWAGTGFLTADGNATQAMAALGLALMAYAVSGLTEFRIPVSRRCENWLSPLVGAATGLVTGATGVFVMPAVPYLQSLGLEKEHLVQALGLSFTVSTIALAVGLASRNAFQVNAGGTSLICTAPAIAGMLFGQSIRGRVNPAMFRLLFFVGLLALGADMAARSLR
jgi:uncharacterized membrane protein YfcA